MTSQNANFKALGRKFWQKVWSASEIHLAFQILGMCLYTVPLRHEGCYLFISHANHGKKKQEGIHLLLWAIRKNMVKWKLSRVLNCGQIFLASSIPTETTWKLDNFTSEKEMLSIQDDNVTFYPSGSRKFWIKVIPQWQRCLIYNVNATWNHNELMKFLRLQTDPKWIFILVFSFNKYIELPGWF